MEKKGSSKGKSQRAMKDLSPRNTQDVKGGKLVDTATPALMKACATGDHFKTATLHV